MSFISGFSEVEDLSKYERSVFSQNGEDGVLIRLFQLIGTSSRYCVEFGAYDGVSGSNTNLLRLQGWNALLMDRMNEVPQTKVHKEFIRADNINELFAKYNVPFEFDLLSIDIDYNDFHIWQAIDSKYRPAVIVIEYNGTHLPNEDKVVKYRPVYCGGGSNYFGASILAMYNLGVSKGYSLVYAESSGTNLFFIRNDILKEKNLVFKDMNQVEKIYRNPTYGTGPNGGHKEDRLDNVYIPSTELLN
jgi:hypothetical protein